MRKILEIKKMLIVFIILFILMLLLSPISKAGYESKPGGTLKYNSVDGHFTNIRKMEISGGTLGLNAILEATTYKDTTENGLDVHMSLATEWGGVALLAVSDHGAFSSNGVVTDSGTSASATTGNITGVFGMADNNSEYVAGSFEGGSTNCTSTLSSADSRYRNEYKEDKTKYHSGDALYQCVGWYSGGAGYVNISSPVYYRSSGLFGFGATDGRNYGGYGPGRYARAAIVCGEGL